MARSIDPLLIRDPSASRTSSRISTALFVATIIVPIVATLLFGGGDTISLGLFVIAVAVMFGCWSFESIRLQEFHFSTNLLQLPLAALVLIGVLQLLPMSDAGLASDALSIPATGALSLDPFATRLFTVRLFFYLLFFAIALSFIDSERRARTIAFVIVIFGSVIAFFGILQRLAQPEAIYGLRPTPQAIPFGPFVNQHHFAAFMEMTSGIVIALLLGSGLKRDRKMFLLIAAAVMSIALVLTGSRGGVISFAGVIMFVVAATYLLKSTGRSSRSTGSSEKTKTIFSAVVGGAAFLLLVVGLAFYLGGGDSVLRGLGVSQIQTDVSSGRIHYWTVAFEIFKAHPILGAGLDAFGNAFTRYDTLSGALRIEQAHNDYLQMLSDGGIVGFACVAAFVFFLFRNGIRNIGVVSDPVMRSITIGALAGCFGIAIHSFFDFPLRTPSNALFFLILCVLATTKFSETRGHR